MTAERTHDLCTSTTGKRTHDLCISTTDNRTHDFCTSTTGKRTNDLCISIIDGEWIYTSSIRARRVIMRGRAVMRNHRFTEHSDESRARSAWTTSAMANFKHLLYNV
ncbi:hypothetical protein Taro_034215 [Colocasia esculenta]|uniref:Uncharacterized protein n=1 Tax=Colocasia esculenta TaxID=4460 RepID=A0A843WEU1_COLES|nr:hypothetical protein [Colocasia esculenta]